MITCYALLRNVGSNLYLSPYLESEKAALLDADTPVVLKSSGMLTKQQKDEASFSLYSAIDFSVDRWIQDKQYIPRLLICAFVFMVTYLFLALAIRDPIPMVDELLGASALTVFCWITLTKRDTRSSLALQRRYALKGKAGSPEYQQEEGMFALEDFLEQMAARDMREICDSLCLVREETFTLFAEKQKGPWAAELYRLLLVHLKVYDKGLYQVCRKVHTLRKNKKPDSKLANRIFHRSMQGNLDVPLLALTVLLAEEEF